ncbi:putative udp-glucuronosyl udp-glucosyltransferase [Rosellinia necatrix]|uniref:Putative udp-glucuronosyl udp-glucosyltransferase n=1 Tax=Rosellinia necatrix TaxID=77044 RepID=A0A1W2TRE8_ROSNE|nr:putative udp-glucuronosyl udp-glucosyltransferase [Rosellinia necatrix]
MADNISTRKVSPEGDAKDPIILVQSFSATGHTVPLLQITRHLIQRGYDIHYLGGNQFRQAIEATGATFIPLVGLCDTWERDWLAVHEFGAGVDIVAGIMKMVAAVMPSMVESLRRALALLRDKEPGREVVVVCEVAAAGGLAALRLGAPLPDGYSRPPRSLGINIVPPLWTSMDFNDLWVDVPYDPAHNRKLNVLLAKLARQGVYREAWEATKTALEACAVFRPMETLFGEHGKMIDHRAWDILFACHDKTLQMCIPSLEYPITDWPPNFAFGGTLPPKTWRTADFVFPDWFAQVQENSAKEAAPPSSSPSSSSAARRPRKKIVAVAQGTLAVDWENVLIPTLQGLAGRADVLVVAILCVRGATLAGRLPGAVPANAIVVDYFPYDAVIEHADVFVSNGSYGVFSHCVAHGVPMVLSGHTEDKVALGMRGAYAGFAVNLGVAQRTPAQFAAGVDAVLADPAYKARAMELRAEAEAFDALGTIERELRALF